MIKKLTSNMEILVENPYGGGCDSITILQNWRGILTLSIKKTSGSRASDVWDGPHIMQLKEEELIKDLNDEIIEPYGWDVTIIRG